METITLTQSDLVLIKKLQVIKTLILKHQQTFLADPASTTEPEQEISYTLIPQNTPTSSSSESPSKLINSLEKLKFELGDTTLANDKSNTGLEKFQDVLKNVHATEKSSCSESNTLKNQENGNLLKESHSNTESYEKQQKSANTPPDMPSPTAHSFDHAKHEGSFASCNSVSTDTTSTSSTGLKSSLSSRSGVNINSYGLHSDAGCYTYKMFCKDLDVKDYSVVKSLEFLIDHTKTKTKTFHNPLPSAPDPRTMIEPEMHALADGLKARAKAYQENLASKNKHWEADPAKGLALLGFGSNSGTTANLQDDNVPSKPVVDEYFLHKSPPIITDLPSSFFPDRAPGEYHFDNEENGDLNHISLDTPQSNSHSDRPSSISSVSSNTILEDFYPEQPADHYNNNKHPLVSSISQLAKNTLLQDDANLRPIALAAARRISQPNISASDAGLNKIHNILITGAANGSSTNGVNHQQQPKRQQIAVTPSFNQNMFGPDGIPNSFRSESSISSINPTTAPSSQNDHMGNFISSNASHRLSSYSDFSFQSSGDFSFRQPRSSQTASSRSDICSSSATNAIDQMNGTGYEGNVTNGSPPMYRPPSIVSSSSSSSSCSSISSSGRDGNYENGSVNQMSASRRGSIWDTFDDPLMEGLVVQEIDGVGTDSWND